MKRSVLGLSLLVLSLSAGPTVAENSTYIPPEEVVIKTIQQSYLPNLDVSEEQVVNWPASIGLKINLQNRHLLDVNFSNPTCDPKVNKSAQSKLDLADAIITMGFFPKQVISNDLPIAVGCSFNKACLPEIKEQTKRYSRPYKLKSNECFFHSIPMAVLTRYPGLFSYEELVSKEHLKRIDSSRVAVLTVQNLRKPWIEFFDKYEKASRESILKLEQEVDSQFKEYWLRTKI